MARFVRYESFAQENKKGDIRRIGGALGFSLAIILVISCGIIPSPVESLPVATVSPVTTPTDLPATPTDAPTPTPAAPTLLASASVPCFTGPGDVYDLVTELQSGEEAEIVGQSEDFWIVRTQTGALCWVPDQGVIAQGEAASVPEVEAPPVPTPAIPSAPVNLEVIGVTCTVDKSVDPAKFVNQFHLYWQDLSNNEAGFRVYRDGDLIANLSADETDFIDEIVSPNNNPHFYYIIAYNEVGEAKSELVSMQCTESGGGGYNPP
jgi:hypothetical protein